MTPAPTAPRFAPADAKALPLHLVQTADLAGFLDSLPARDAAWLKATGFEAALGEVRLMPAADGGVSGAVAGLGSAKRRAQTRFGIAKAVAGLPAGAWSLTGDQPQALLEEAALA